MSILTTRNLATRLLAVPRLTAGVYYTDISYTTRANESKLNEGLSKRFEALALENGESPPETGRDHDFTLTVFSVQNEIALPGWLHQTFVL